MAKNKIEVFPVLLSRYGDDHLLADGSALPMGCLMAYIKHYKHGFLRDVYHFHPLVSRTRSSWNDYRSAAQTLGDTPSVWLFSNYVWNIADNLMMAAAVKALNPASLIVMGGPHVPAYPHEAEAFFRKHSYVDIAVRGEGERTLSEILELFAISTGMQCDFSAIAGLTFRREGGFFIRTADRVRSSSLDDFPSPFLTGEFDHGAFFKGYGIFMETNRGCPYGCTYCDWGSAILQKVRHFNLERVLNEIDYIGRNEYASLTLADANFGAFERDIKIAEAIADANRKYGYPKKFSTSNAKNASPVLGEIVKILTNAGIISQGTLALQSIDEKVLDAVNRSNIKLKKHAVLMDIFKKENLLFVSELLIGLPEQTYESHKKDLQFVFDRKITAVAYRVQMMPNAPMNEPSYREKYKITVDEEGYITSTISFDEKHLQDICTLFLGFQFYYMLGVLKYILYFVQLEHEIMALDVIDRLINIPDDKKDCYPFSAAIREDILTRLNPRSKGVMELLWTTADSAFLFNRMDEYYDEVFNFLVAEFGIEIDPSVIKTLKAVQMAVMPALGKVVPMKARLEHDFVDYFEQIKQAHLVDRRPDGFRLLKEFCAGDLVVQALKSKVIDNLTLVMADTKTAHGWELRSPLRFVSPRIRKKAVISE